MTTIDWSAFDRNKYTVEEAALDAYVTWAETLIASDDPELIVPWCWAWPTPPEDATLDNYLTERCAICGRAEQRGLVNDHCHRSGLRRGWLCRDCNASEGAGAQGMYQRYRERPPAVILGWTQPYRWWGMPQPATPETWVSDRLGAVPSGEQEAARYLAAAAALDEPGPSFTNNALSGIGL